jgi:hypothetical protein
MGSKGIVASTAALAVLLQEGIGDTIRISLTPEPGGDRTREVIVAQEILQTMGIRSFAPMVIACPGCGRTTSTTFQELAQDIQSYVRTRMPDWQRDYPGFETLQLAVMGCIVNGPGESKHADIGISLPGTGELPAAPIFIDGKKAMTLRGENLSQQFKDIVEDYVKTPWGAGASCTVNCPTLIMPGLDPGICSPGLLRLTGLLPPLHDEPRRRVQHRRLFSINGQARDRLVHQLRRACLRTRKPQQVHEGGLAHPLVLLRGLAHRLGRRFHVENVVRDLEGEADLLGIEPQRGGVGPAQNCARLAGIAEQRTRSSGTG